MPTFQEFKDQLDAAGVTDQARRNQMIAEAYQSGEIERGQLLTPTPGRMAEPQVGGITGAIHRAGKEAFTRGERKGEFLGQVGEAITTSEPYTRGQRAGEFLGEVATGRPSETRLAKEAALAETPAAPPDLSPGEGAFGPELGEVSTQSGVDLPPVRVPGVARLEKALAAVPEAYRGAEAGIKKAYEKERGAIEEWAETEKAATQAQAGVMLERDRVARDLEAQRVGKEQERQAYVDTEMGKVRDAVDQMKTSKIDPYRFYRHPDGSTNYPKSIAAAIAVGLGALGSSLPAQYGGTGGPNVALQIIDKAIDRDISAQRDDIANQRAGVGIQMNLLSQMRQQFGDERQAENAARVVMLETYKMKLEETAAQSGDKRIQSKAAMLIATADQKEAALLGDMEINAAKEGALGEKTLYGARAQQAKMRAQQEAQRAKLTAAAPGAAPPGLRVLPGGYVPDKDDRKAAQKMAKTYGQVKIELRKLMEWRRAHGAEVLDREALREGNALLNRVKSVMRAFDETGARLEEAELEMMGLELDVGEVGYVMKQLETVDASIDAKAKAGLSPYGFGLAGAPTGGARRR